MNEQKIYAITKPSINLLILYLIRSILSLIFFPIVFPYLFLRYYTLRYHFDTEGISLKWGFFFKKEVNLTYSRIQDIHVSSGLLQRWLKLADIKIQTASGSAEAEITIEGITNYEELRDFLYSKMRGSKVNTQVSESEDIKILSEIKDELSRMRQLLERAIEKNQQN